MPPPSLAPPARGNPSVDLLLPLVYDELKALAGRYLRGESKVTLHPTSLVHEAYLRLSGQRRLAWNDRAHFFRLAAQTMRRVLVDHCRERQAQKRGGSDVRITLVDSAAVAPPIEVDLLALESALARLEGLDPQQARIVELRFFAGMTVEESAEVLGISPATIKRDWAMAKAWLFLEISGAASSDGT